MYITLSGLSIVAITDCGSSIHGISHLKPLATLCVCLVEVAYVINTILYGASVVLPDNIILYV